eukprot:jgi/Chrzof1/8102/UNPLg00147.t1
MSQQRKRRYLSVLMNDMTQDPRHPRPVWDSNCITPGTQFMDDLAAALRQWMSSYQWPFEIVLTDARDPGEGEHKAVNYIQANCTPGDGVNVVYGLDADLIMLSLLMEAKGHSMQLMRETRVVDNRYATAHDNSFTHLQSGVLASAIVREVLKGPAVTDTVAAAVLRDYTILCMLLGNDFLPHLTFLTLHNRSSLNILIDTYRSVSESTKGYLVSTQEPYTIDMHFLTDVLKKLAGVEDQNTAAVDTNWYACTPRLSVMDTADAYPLRHKPPNTIRPGTIGWRPRYYRHLFSFDDPIAVKNVCSDYIQGLQWTAAYYLQGSVMSNWYYKFPYSPTARDLELHLTESLAAGSTADANDHDATFQDCEPQLLMVLPPRSAHLLSPDLQQVMFDLRLGCSHNYPATFQLMTYLKHHLYECIPKLPLISLQDIKTAVRYCQRGGAEKV